MIRVCIGDTGVPIGGIPYLESPYNEMFWVYLLFTILMCTLIFLNFVITKACHAYDTISERLEEYILRDRANMIAEADAMKPFFLKNVNNYPKYFVVR